MKKALKMNGALHKTKSYLKRSSPSILVCAGAIGVMATAVMAVKATPKALDLIRGDSRRNHDGDPYARTKLEAIRSCWRCYIPSALMGLSTICCIFGANALSKRNQASLASAYALLNQSYQRYREAANSVYGKDANSKIKAQMAKATYISADGYSLYSEDLDSESEKILCYDLYSRRYFTTTMASVLNAEYHLNRNLSLRGDASVNEFYEFLGIDKIDCGDEIGWSMDYGIEDGFMWLDFENSHVEMDDGMECRVISAIWPPTKL
ncbi:MAG: DUF6353 family protein [Clostridiales bacterium]|jgi:hypothetical protein|nr:DUF6353 family protein [Clostridiales bacterium]